MQSFPLPPNMFPARPSSNASGQSAGPVDTKSLPSKLLGRPLVSAAIAGGVVNLVLGEEGSLRVFNMSVPVWLWTAIVVGASDAASETIANVLLPYIPNMSPTATNAVQTFLPAGSAGLATVAANGLLGLSDSGNFPSLFLLSAGSVFAGSYINDRFLSQ